MARIQYSDQGFLSLLLPVFLYSFSSCSVIYYWRTQCAVLVYLHLYIYSPLHWYHRRHTVTKHNSFFLRYTFYSEQNKCFSHSTHSLTNKPYAFCSSKKIEFAKKFSIQNNLVFFASRENIRFMFAKNLCLSSIFRLSFSLVVAFCICMLGDGKSKWSNINDKCEHEHVYVQCPWTFYTSSLSSVEIHLRLSPLLFRSSIARENNFDYYFYFLINVSLSQNV